MPYRRYRRYLTVDTVPRCHHAFLSPRQIEAVDLTRSYSTIDNPPYLSRVRRQEHAMRGLLLLRVLTNARPCGHSSVHAWRDRETGQNLTGKGLNVASCGRCEWCQTQGSSRKHARCRREQVLPVPQIDPDPSYKRSGHGRDYLTLPTPSLSPLLPPLPSAPVQWPKRRRPSSTSTRT
jgi:hypothetical protein